MSAEWHHNENKCQWELRAWDEPRQEWDVGFTITDELIAGVSDKLRLAVSIAEKYGRKCVPPPLQGYLGPALKRYR